jgi:hypothetical protein
MFYDYRELWRLFSPSFFLEKKEAKIQGALNVSLRGRQTH